MADDNKNIGRAGGKRLDKAQKDYLDKKQEEKRLNDQLISDMEELVDLGGQLNTHQQKRLKTLKDENLFKTTTVSLEKKLTKQAQSLNDKKSKQASLAKAQIDSLKKTKKTTDMTEESFQKQVSLVEQLSSGMATIEEVQESINDLGKDATETMKEYMGVVKGTAEANEVNKGWLDAADNLTGGMASKAKEARKTFKDLGPKAGFIAVGLMAAVAALISFSSQLDAIGDKFGAIGVQDFSRDLTAADAEMAKLGFDTGAAAEIASKLSTEFGVGFEESIGLASEIGNMSKALGMSADEGATLIGQLTTIGGLSTDTAIQYAKQTEMLAAQEGVAPGVVMKDIAANAEMFAKFGQDGGKNLMGAAIQAKKLGTDLGTVAGIAEGLLDFQSSIQSEMEASVMIGRQLNFQKARELALNNDIEGAMSEIISQVGTEAEFNAMNALQRKALADSIGVGVDQMAKFVANQDKAATLGDRIADQKGFADLVGEDAMSSLAQFMGSLKAIGAELMNVFGPTLNAIAGVFSTLASKLQESKGLMTALQAVVGALGLKLLFMGLSAIWSGVFAALSFIPFVGPGLATAGAYAAVAAMMASVYQGLSVGDMMSPADGKTQVSTKEGGLFNLSKNDDLLAGPGIAGGASSGGGAQFAQMSQAINNLTMKVSTLIDNFDNNYVPAIVASNVEGAKGAGKSMGRQLATGAV